MKELKFKFKVKERVLERFFTFLQEAEEDEREQIKQWVEDAENEPETNRNEFEYSSGGRMEEQAYAAMELLRELAIQDSQDY